MTSSKAPTIHELARNFVPEPVLAAAAAPRSREISPQSFIRWASDARDLTREEALRLLYILIEQGRVVLTPVYRVAL